MKASAGLRRQLVTVQNSAPPVPDGDGGYTEQWADASPAEWFVQITSASAHDLERVQAGSVIASAARLVRGPYRPDVITKSRLLLDGRTMNVVAVLDLDERRTELECVCAEQVI